jgi:prepilin-type N-terminal cleavage/methylation domain-containing protein
MMRLGAPRDVRPRAVARLRGVTLVELLVVIALLGLLAGVTGLTLGAAKQVPSASAEVAAASSARRQALERGEPVTVTVNSGSVVRSLTALPDGSVIGDPDLPIERLTGRPPRGQGERGEDTRAR